MTTRLVELGWDKELMSRDTSQWLDFYISPFFRLCS